MKRVLCFVIAQLTVVTSVIGNEPQTGWPVVAAPGVKTPTIADLDGDGFPEILVNSFSGTYAYNNDGKLLPGWPFTFFSGAIVGPLVGDVDGDSVSDIVVQPANGSDGVVYALTLEATVKSGWPVQAPDPLSALYCLADVNGDGADELVVLSISSRRTIYAFTGSGKLVPGWPVVLTGLNGSFFWGGLAAGDLEFDGQDEIVVTGNLYTGGSHPSAVPIYVLNGDGSIRRGWPVLQQGPDGLTNPIIVDLNGDFVCEIVGAGQQTVYFYQANSQLYAPHEFIGDGVIHDPTVSDLDNDGSLELVTASRQLHVLDIEAGQTRVRTDSDYNLFSGITIGDVDSDGNYEIAVGSAFLQDNRQYALHVYDNNLEHLSGWPKDFGLCLDNGVFPGTAMADLDHDSDLEIVNICNDQIHVWDQPNPSGSPVIVDWPMRAHDSSLSSFYHRGIEPSPVFTRGDANRDETVDISDVISISHYLFLNAPSDCPARMDVNSDEKVDVADPMALAGYLFLGGPPPEAPFPECDTGPDSVLPCLEFVCP